MTEIHRPRFLTDEEKLRHYARISGVKLEDYSHTYNIKVYEGSEILLYYLDEHGEVIPDTVLTCVDINVSAWGIKVKLVNRKDHRVLTIGEVPNFILHKNLVVHTPHRCEIERTVKLTHRNKFVQGVCAALAFRSRSNPQDKLPLDLQAIQLIDAPGFLGAERVKRAFAQLEEGG